MSAIGSLPRSFHDESNSRRNEECESMLTLTHRDCSARTNSDSAIHRGLSS